jgi:hypothetical protein
LLPTREYFETKSARSYRRLFVFMMKCKQLDGKGRGR